MSDAGDQRLSSDEELPRTEQFETDESSVVRHKPSTSALIDGATYEEFAYHFVQVCFFFYNFFRHC